MFVQTETTPNPSTLKFIPGRRVLSGSGAADYKTAEEAQGRSPLASRLFEVDGVESVMLGEDFIAVTKADPADWQTLRPLVLMEIVEHYTLGGGEEGAASDRRPPGDSGEARHADLDGPDGPVVAQIIELIDTRVRPAVARDGGDIVFHGFDKGIVYLKMRGACAGCPSATATLKMGIENMLRHYIPEVIEVQAVRD